MELAISVCLTAKNALMQLLVIFVYLAITLKNNWVNVHPYLMESNPSSNPRTVRKLRVWEDANLVAPLIHVTSVKMAITETVIKFVLVAIVLAKHVLGAQRQIV